MMKNIFLIILTIGLFSSCIDKIELNKSETTPKLIVDGSINDQEGPYTVKLSYSVPYTNDTTTQPVQQAQITIVEEGGKSATLKEIEPGIYKTDTLAIRGVVGKSYFIKIKTADGKQYESKPEKILPPLPVDSVYSKFVSATAIGNDTKSDIFEIFVKTKDLAGQKNYYRWKWTHFEKIDFCKEIYRSSDRGRFVTRANCCTDCWKIDPCTDCINVANDELTDGNFIEKRIGTAPFTSIDPYFLLIEQYSISYDYHRFWQTATSQIFNTGGIFDSPPIQVQGNVTCTSDPNEQVVGYFSAAGLSLYPIYIDRSKTGKIPTDKTPANFTQVLESTCAECAGIYRTRKKPLGW